MEVAPSPAARPLQRSRTKDVGATPRRPDLLTGKPTKVAPKRLDSEFAAADSSDVASGQGVVEVSVTPSSIGPAVSTPSRGSTNAIEVLAGISFSSASGVTEADDASPGSASSSSKPESVVTFEGGEPGAEATAAKDLLLTLARFLAGLRANSENATVADAGLRNLVALQQNLANQRSRYRITSADEVSPRSVSRSVTEQFVAAVEAGSAAITNPYTETASVSEEHLLALARILARFQVTPEGALKETAPGEDQESGIPAKLSQQLPRQRLRFRDVTVAVDCALLVMILLTFVLFVASRMGGRSSYHDFTPT